MLILGLLPMSAAVRDELHGKIIDAQNRESVPAVVIQALNVNGKAIAFASSNADGNFNIKVTATVDSLLFKCMGYETVKLPLTYDFESGIELQPKATQLRDVIVKAPDIYAKGDTLVFNVSRYANESDNAIIDVIKRLPGIKVEDDGTIKYQGKPINKFYIDGDDFLGGQYGLATDNISYEDVKSVEVMENHQPIKALEGIEFPEEAGINLKLKDDAKGRWVGVTKAGSGLEPLLYDGSVYAMRIAPKVQNILTLRGGNTGWNPDEQVTDHDFNDMSFSDYTESLWPEYISADIINAPLNEKRTRDSRSWLANSITAWKHGDASMRVTLNYVGERLDFNSSVYTDYFSNSIPNFSQNNSLSSRFQNLSVQFNTQINKRGYFLKNKIIAKAIYEKSNSDITGSFDLDQMISRRNMSVANDLKLVKRNDKKLFELTSRNSFSYRPDRLFIDGSENITQNIGSTDFRSTTETRYGKLGRFWKFYLAGGFDFDYHRLSTRLIGMTGYDNDESYNSTFTNLYIIPKVNYERNGWLLSASLPVKWLYQSLHSTHHHINASPGLSAKKSTSSKSEISASVTYRLSSPQAYTAIEVPILSDYRNMFIANSNGTYSQSVSSSVTYRYRNPLTSFFTNAAISYNYVRSALTTNQLFIEDFIISTYADRLTNSSSWIFSGGVSKGLGHSRMVIGCDFDVTTSSANAMRDNDLQNYKQQSLVLKPYFKGNIMKWLSANYDANYGFSKLKVAGTDYETHTFNQKLYATIMPGDTWQFSFGAEHFMTRFPGGHTDNLVLLDASVVYSLSSQIRLSFTANNLLNKRQYQYVTYGTLSRSEHSFRIRPRNILASIQYRF